MWDVVAEPLTGSVSFLLDSHVTIRGMIQVFNLREMVPDGGHGFDIRYLSESQSEELPLCR